MAAESLKDIIKADIGAVFCADDLEFCDRLEIGPSSDAMRTAYGSLQQNILNNGSFDAGSPLQKCSHMLYCAYPIGGDLWLENGDPIYINKEAYRVVDIQDEMGLATILLEKGKKR